MATFRQFRNNVSQNGFLWTESTSLFPYQCSQCQRIFEKGGHRWLGSPIAPDKQTHHKAIVLCDDCRSGHDPHRKPVPVLAERKTELD